MTDNHGFHSRKTNNIQWFVIIVFTAIFVSSFIPVPYFVMTPGSAIELGELVEVKNGFDEKGKLMLTTVSMGQGSVTSYIKSYFSDYMELIPEEYILNDNEDPDDYSRKQLKIMKNSQDDAIIAAFNYLKLPIQVKPKGILVMGIIPNMPSEGVLQIGDLITKVDEQRVDKINDLLNYIETKEVGEYIEVTFLRESKEKTVSIPLVNLSEAYGVEGMPKEKLGIGFYPFEEREVIPSKEVTFKTEKIGGPSAGLMFTLEIINQLTSEDITKGMLIAGTGTINSDGEVGQIGGANLKVKAAYEKGATIFFVPKDIEVDDDNQKNAELSNQELGNPLKIVPVRDVSEAMEFLSDFARLDNQKAS